MKRYIAKCNKVVTCIYGTRQFIEGLEVPEFFARRFPQYVNCIEQPDAPAPAPAPAPKMEEIINKIKETIINTSTEDIETKFKKKKEN